MEHLLGDSARILKLRKIVKAVEPKMKSHAKDVRALPSDLPSLTCGHRLPGN